LHVTKLLRQTTTQSNSGRENIITSFKNRRLTIEFLLYNILQYPDVVSLQAIVGQSAGQAPSQADQAAATAAANVATSGVDDPSETTSAALNAAASPGTFASYNPMAWLTSPPAPASSDTTANVGSANKADV
jgi:hypothetical protein